MYVKMSPGVCTWSLPSSLPYVINLVGFGVSGALLKSQARWDLSLRSTAFGLTLSPSTKRQLLDGLCLLVTCSEVTGQSQLRENFLSSSTLILMDNTHTHNSTDLSKMKGLWFYPFTLLSHSALQISYHFYYQEEWLSTFQKDFLSFTSLQSPPN